MKSRTVLQAVQRDWWSVQHSASRNASTTSKFSLLTMILLTASRKPGTVRTYMHTHSAPKLICCPICCPGALNVTHVCSPFFLPRSLFGLFHILFAHLRQVYLMLHLLFVARRCDIYIVDQLSTCIPFIRLSGCSSVAGWSSTATSQTNCWQMESILTMIVVKSSVSWLPQANLLFPHGLLGGTDDQTSRFTPRQLGVYCQGRLVPFPSIERKLRIVYPGINIEKYKPQYMDADVADVVS
jgi:alpha-1,3/alpha-1,6-mannosyltransferase